MINSRRDYLLRIIAEVGQLLARALHQRRNGTPEDALQSVVQGCERLFQMEADQLFQFTPDQHALMLTEGLPAADARDALLLYAALNQEAGEIYERLGNTAITRASRVNALRFTLRARLIGSPEPEPAFAPSVESLRGKLGEDLAEPDIQALVEQVAGMDRQ